MNIYLVGFMGTGKTTVGRELAKNKKWPFIDLDKLIEIREKRKISDIFAKEGEVFFRKLEKETLQDISKNNDQVVACGGGIVIDRDNIQIMKETGKIICLSASVEIILKRTSKYSHRPLLNVPDPKERVASLLRQRARFYALADRTIDTSRVSVKEVVDQVLQFVSS